jgi:hypothetical protein
MQCVGASGRAPQPPERVSRYTAQAFQGHRGLGRYLDTPDGTCEKNGRAV